MITPVTAGVALLGGVTNDPGDPRWRPRRHVCGSGHRRSSTLSAPRPSAWDRRGRDGFKQVQRKETGLLGAARSQTRVSQGAPRPAVSPGSASRGLKRYCFGAFSLTKTFPLIVLKNVRGSFQAERGMREDYEKSSRGFNERGVLNATIRLLREPTLGIFFFSGLITLTSRYNFLNK